MSSIPIADIDDDEVKNIVGHQTGTRTPQKLRKKSIELSPPVFQLYNIQMRSDLLTVVKRF